MSDIPVKTYIDPLDHFLQTHPAHEPSPPGFHLPASQFFGTSPMNSDADLNQFPATLATGRTALWTNSISPLHTPIFGTTNHHFFEWHFGSYGQMNQTRCRPPKFCAYDIWQLCTGVWVGMWWLVRYSIDEPQASTIGAVGDVICNKLEDLCPA